jgi:hypothetical protein
MLLDEGGRQQVGSHMVNVPCDSCKSQSRGFVEEQHMLSIIREMHPRFPV